ncbi:MAG: MaoC/PaaZ C-terminal domain-containing protein [Hyphomicrobiaceae bacterium]|nr:MaoC/PaaZ C-terminal domain-containing protein [Hyphomicrobiaceae bacterium]
MVVYNPRAVLDGNAPGPWGPSVAITYTKRDVLLYAVGIGARDLRFVYEGHPGFAVFPTFPIRWGATGLVVDETALPPTPGPLTIDAERHLEVLGPLPLEGTVEVRSRLVSVHPRGKGNAFVEIESEVSDAGRPCVRMVTGVFRRGVEKLGDIEPFEGAGESRSVRLPMPDRKPDVEVSARIADNQAHVYRLSGDYNPLHIDPDAARFGGFEAPILHGLCTLGHSADMLLGALAGGDPARFSKLKVRFSSPVFPGDELGLRAWRESPTRVVFDVRARDKTVISDAFFEFK